MIQDKLIEISKNFEALDKSIDQIIDASKIMISSLKEGGKILFCGNGGSAADAQHLAAELIGRYKKKRDPIAGLALTTDTSIITAIANDFGYENIFSRQISALGKPNDVLYAISTSGKSENIVMAIDAARERNMHVIGITGENGNLMDDKCDLLIKVPSKSPDRIQEMHIAIGQIICEIIENQFSN